MCLVTARDSAGRSGEQGNLQVVRPGKVKDARSRIESGDLSPDGPEFAIGFDKMIAIQTGVCPECMNYKLVRRGDLLVCSGGGDCPTFHARSCKLVA